MGVTNNINPILITGAERSGSTLIARILDMCGVWSGHCNKMFENIKIMQQFPTNEGSLFPETSFVIPFWFEQAINDVKSEQNWKGQKWMIKGSKLAQYWPIMHNLYPDAKWLIVRRRTGDVVQSCIKTGYMTTFKRPMNLEALNFKSEEEGWLWWIHQYENKFVEMMQSGLNCRIIWPDRMVTGNFKQVQETLEWLGVKWNDKIPEVISPLLEKSRRIEKWQE